jgi:uncharacterized protein YjlB
LSVNTFRTVMPYYGIQSALAQTSTSALEQDMAEGRKVIVQLNAETIWRHTTYVAPNFHPGAHAVVVTGTKAGVVHLQRQRRQQRQRRAGFHRHLRAGVGHHRPLGRRDQVITPTLKGVKPCRGTYSVNL